MDSNSELLELNHRAKTLIANNKSVSTTDYTAQLEQFVVDFGTIAAENHQANSNLTGELSELKNQLQTIIDSIPDRIYVKDTESRFTLVNEAMIKWFDKNNIRDVIGKTDFDFFSEEHAAQASSDEQQIIKTGNPILNFEEKETWIDKKTTWALSSKMPYYAKDKQIIGTLGISRDITAIKEAEEIQKQAADIFQNIQIGLYIYQLEQPDDDHTLRLIAANPASEKQIGTAPAQIIGKYIDECFPGLRAAGIIELFIQALVQNKQFTVEDFTYAHQNINNSFSFTIFPLPNQKIGVSFENITEKKQTQQQLDNYRKHLEEIVLQRTNELNFALEKINQANAELSDVNAVLSLKNERLNNQSSVLRKEVVKRLRIEKELKNYKENLECLVDERTKELTQAEEELKQQVEEYEVINEELLESNEKISEINKQLIDNQAYLSSIFKAAPIGIGMEISNIFLFADEMMATITGYEVGDLIGKSSSIFYRTDDEFIAVKNDQIIQISEKGVSTLETQWRTKQGKLIYILLSASPIHENDLSRGITITALDISQRKKTEIDARQSRRMLQTILDTIPVRVFWKDINLNYLGCNKTFATDARLDKPEYIIGMNDHQLTWKSSAEIYQTDDREVISTGVSKLNYEERMLFPNNEVGWLLTSKVPLRDVEDNIIGIIGVYQDISERKRTEQQIKETNQSLQEMVYIASHDLQVPLVSIEGYASELLETYKERLDDDGVYCLERLKSNAQRMHQLVLSLLDISRLNTRRLPYERFDLNDTFTKIINDLSLTIEKSGVKITSQPLPNIYADKVRIEGVIRNLITNAINYSGKIINIGYNNNTLWVKDNGIGIPPDQLERIFNPGERLKMIKADGVGMGLTFCKKVIEQHEGRIWAESEGMRKGACFYIEFQSNTIIRETI